MPTIARSTRYCLFVIVMGFAQAASCAVIPVGATSAADLIFDFNFSTAVPPPPYIDVNYSAVITAGPPFPTLSIDTFGGLGGVGPDVLSGSFAVPSVVNIVGVSAPSVVDGVFSVGFRVDAGVAEIQDITATAFTATDSSVTINGVPAAAPEPATLALLGVGLAGLALARRRSRGLQSTAV